MPKAKKAITVRIPAYISPRQEWRRRIARSVQTEQRRTGVFYSNTDKIEVRVCLYIKPPRLSIHDLDNRLKDILDALQGRFGGPQKVAPRSPTIPNDRQIWRITAQKAEPPWQSNGLGHLEIRAIRRPITAWRS
jgi:hypothetical protein